MKARRIQMIELPTDLTLPMPEKLRKKRPWIASEPMKVWKAAVSTSLLEAKVGRQQPQSPSTARSEILLARLIQFQI